MLVEYVPIDLVPFPLLWLDWCAYAYGEILLVWCSWMLFTFVFIWRSTNGLIWSLVLGVVVWLCGCLLVQGYALG